MKVWKMIITAARRVDMSLALIGRMRVRPQHHAGTLRNKKQQSGASAPHMIPYPDSPNQLSDASPCEGVARPPDDASSHLFTVRFWFDARERGESG
jgi:hypothetical protein